MPKPATMPHLLALYDQAFDRAAWHGTPLWGALRGVRVVLHTAYWKYIVRRRLLGDPELSFPRPGSNWFPLPSPPDERAWRRDVVLLKEQHRLLRAVIARFPASRLGARAWRSRWTNSATIYGIASHDLYHAGQIQLLKRLRRRDPS